MKYVLVKYKNIKLLINKGLPMQPLVNHIADIEALECKVSDFYKNLMSATAAEGKALDKEKADLVSKIGYKIVGVPFTNHDAELYAVNNAFEYDVLELHGNTGNKYAVKPEKEFEQINIRVEKPLKTLAVKHVNESNHKNLTQYIEYLIRKDLDLE